MKQRITEEQYNELNDKQKYTWYRAMLDAGHHMIFPNHDDGMLELEGFPSIGEMIEFLGDDYYKVIADDWKNDNYIGVEWGTGIDDFKSPKLDELCDALWKAVKEVLNNHENKRTTS